MRTTVPYKIKETHFERQYGRKPRTEFTNYLNLPTDNHKIISAQPKNLQVYSFNNGKGAYDQQITKTPRRLKCDVTNKFLYKFIEEQNKTKKNSKTNTKQNHKQKWLEQNIRYPGILTK